MGLLALILMGIIIGALGVPANAIAASIGCGQCHGTAPLSSSASEQATGHRTGYESTPGYEDQKTPVNPDICTGKGRGLHGTHMNYSSASYGGNGTNTILGVTYIRRGNCNYCHNKHPHENGYVEFSGMSPTARQKVSSAGVRFSGTGMGPNGVDINQMDGTGTCTNACHKNAGSTANWGNYTATTVGGIKLTCVSCHGDVTNSAGMTGAHGAHVGSTIPTGGAANMNAAGDAGCVNCHPDNTGDLWKNGKADNGSKKAYPHASDGTNVVAASAFVNATVIGTGTRNGLSTTCAKACHRNTTTALWGDSSLGCDACHYYSTTPTYAGNSSAVVKLNSSHGQHFNQNANCPSCHAVPGSGDTSHVTALPVVNSNASVISGVGYSTTAKTCSTTGASCHGTGMTTPAWGNPLNVAECAICHEYPNTTNTWTGGNSHLAHTTASDYNASTDKYSTVTSDSNKCGRCHRNGTHRDTHINISSAVAPGLTYNTTNSNCTNACHKNRNAVWGGGMDCNACHFRSGSIGSVAPSGLHVTNDKSWKHYSSVIKVNGVRVGCKSCHPNNDTDTGTPKTHISSTDFVKRANMSEAHTYVNVTGIGYTKGTLPTDGTCAKSCHYNATDPFGNFTICFKPGQKRRFGVYQTASWGDTDLKCNECHSTPSQEATFRSLTSTAVYGGYTTLASRNANSRHEKHMFEYKLNPWNFQNEDRNIYCDDCHRTPDINTLRGFRNHSTLGSNSSGIIELPVKSQNAKVNLSFRNNNKGRDGVNPATFVRGTCSNIYCHTIMTEGKWTEEACDSCHGKKDGVNVGSGAPGYINWTANYRTFEDYSGGGGAHYTHVTKRGYPCRTCHYDGGGDGNPANHHNLSNTVYRDNVNVGVQPQYWFNNKTSFYNKTTRSCSDVKCHYGASQNWDCTPLH